MPEKESIESFAAHQATMVIFLSTGMLEELSRAYALPAPNLMDGFDPRDASRALSCFDRALAEYRHCYDTVHLPVEQYTCEHEWQETYLMPASASLH